MGGLRDFLGVCFNSISTILDGREGDNERIRAMELHLRLKRILPQIRFEPRLARKK